MAAVKAGKDVRMEENRILIAISDENSAAEIQGTLTEMDYTVVGIAHTYPAAVRAINSLEPDVAIMDAGLWKSRDKTVPAPLPDHILSVPIIFLLSDDDDEQFARHITDCGGFGCVSHPVDNLLMRCSIESALRWRETGRGPIRIAGEQMKLQSEALLAAANGIVITDREGVILWSNPAFSRLTGYTEEEVIGRTPRVVKSGVHPAEFYASLWNTIISGEVWRGEVTNRRKDGSLYTEEMTITPVRNSFAVITNFIAIKQDVSGRKKAEEDLRRSLQEKEMLLREIHHRVKNNFQIIVSLINLQSHPIVEKGTRGIFRDIINRIRAMALVHERLYGSNNITSIDMGKYAGTLASEILRSFNTDSMKINIGFELEQVILGIDQAVPCGLIINEILTNSFKHAFPPDFTGKPGITLKMHMHDGKTAEIRIDDNGIGLPAGTDFRNSKSFGMQLIAILEEQIGGTIEQFTTTGTHYRIRFPIMRTIPN